MRDGSISEVRAGLFRRFGLTSYDAAYLGLAQSQDAGLITFYKKLRTAAEIVGVLVLPR